MIIQPIRNDEGALIGFRRETEMSRFRYFQRRRGPMFSWTTEKMEGRYASFIHRPVGRGSRSGKAERWEFDEESLQVHALRKDAKARALRLFKEWEAK